MRSKNSKMEAIKPLMINVKNLPLSCSGNAALFLEHPKIYLPIEKTGQEICPYCGAHYILEK